MSEAEQRLLDKSKLTEADQNIAKVLAGRIGNYLEKSPEAALMALHTPLQRMMVLRLCFEISIAAIDAMMDIEEDVTLENNNPVN
jgi:hypothetical protein